MCYATLPAVRTFEDYKRPYVNHCSNFILPSQIHPLTGPREGGTKVTITGANLGLYFREVWVQVAGVQCLSVPSQYISAER